MRKPDGQSSKNIFSAGYDPEYSCFGVRFRSGGIYYCWPVTSAAYEDFLAAESPTAWYNANIKFVEEVTVKRVGSSPPVPLKAETEPAALAVDTSLEKDPRFDRDEAAALLARKVGELAVIRRNAAAALADYDSHLQAYLETVPMAELKRMKDTANKALEAMDGAVRLLAVYFFANTGETAVHPYVKIKQITKITYDKQQALNWAKTHAPLGFVKVETVPQPNIAQDLSAMLAPSQVVIAPAQGGVVCSHCRQPIQRVDSVWMHIPITDPQPRHNAEPASSNAA